MRLLGISRGDWQRRFIKLAALVWRLMMVRTTFVAITGSVGKTTGKELIVAMLATRGSTLATEGTRNEAMAVAQTLLRVRPWHRFAVIEVGTDSPGWIRRSAALVRPDVAVVLNVKRTHTTRFPALEDTAREKADLPAALRRGGVAILNCDDPYVARMSVPAGRRTVWFGEGPQAGVRASEIQSAWPARLTLRVTAMGESCRLETRLVGKHWATSVVAATSAALACGVPLEQVARAAATVPPFPGRMQPAELPCGAVVLRDDFNPSIDTFHPALEVLREARAARKLLVITTVSDSGESWNQRLLHIAMGAAGCVDILILIGEQKNTRTAARQLPAAGFPAAQLHCCTGLQQASDLLRKLLRAGDLVLLRGRSSDHVGRLYHDQLRPAGCWTDYCPKMILCDDCQELFAADGAAGLVQIQPAV